VVFFVAAPFLSATGGSLTLDRQPPGVGGARSGCAGKPLARGYSLLMSAVSAGVKKV
jgi:hypothetical protein